MNSSIPFAAAAAALRQGKSQDCDQLRPCRPGPRRYSGIRGRTSDRPKRGQGLATAGIRAISRFAPVRDAGTGTARRCLDPFACACWSEHGGEQNQDYSWPIRQASEDHKATGISGPVPSHPPITGPQRSSHLRTVMAAPQHPAMTARPFRMRAAEVGFAMHAAAPAMPSSACTGYIPQYLITDARPSVRHQTRRETGRCPPVCQRKGSVTKAPAAACNVELALSTDQPPARHLDLKLSIMNHSSHDVLRSQPSFSISVRGC